METPQASGSADLIVEQDFLDPALRALIKEISFNLVKF